MAKLQRKSAKLFASEATATAGGLAQFGSLAAGTPNYSTDPDVIQALDAYKEGWSSAVLGTKSPALEDRNALDYLLSYQQAYIMQHGIPEWLDTETYYENSYVIDSNGELRVSVIDNNTGHDPIEDEGAQYWGYAGARGAGKQIGEVYFSESSSAEDNKGGLPLFTGELISNADQLYPQFYAWLSAHDGNDKNNLLISQSLYDNYISSHGECCFYVLDTVNKTIRLPKLRNYIRMAETSAGITQLHAGLPNITGTFAGNDIMHATGAFSVGGSNNGGQYNGNISVHDYSFSASSSNSIYGNSNTVTPAHTTLFPWVCAYNGAAPASVAQAAQFQAALTSKADTDFANVTSTGTSSSAGWAMPSDTYENLTFGASGTTYTAPANGYFVFHFSNSGLTNHWVNILINGVFIGNWWASVANNTFAITEYMVKKGDVLKLEYGSDITGAWIARFYYAEGSKSEA